MNNYIIYILAFATSVIISYIAVPAVKKIANKIKAIDDPNENERKIHKKIMPRLGGLAIYLGFILAYIVFSNILISSNYQVDAHIQLLVQLESLLVAGFLILIMGIVDDIYPINAKNKFIIQIIAALIIVLRGGFVINEINIILSISLPPIIAEIITVLWIIGITNAINFSDGLDGLAGGISLITLVTIATIGLVENSYYSVIVVFISLILAGGIVGFLPFNFPPAKIFMGDTGSQFIGFMIGAISILGYKQAAFTSFLIPIVILAVPIFDICFAFFRRIINKIPAHAPDANHLHHRLLRSTKSTTKSLVVIFGISIAFSFSSIAYSVSKTVGILLVILTVVIAEVLIEYFLIIGPNYAPVLYLISKLFPNSHWIKKRKKRVLTYYREQNKS
ncbi:MraY family glycosyltransferase [Culicoidibacter larvae]|uniref:Undecaprenyl/decaprenyl-phosphate alpha-N-acetylglucosaminyl 1-phosphate transferase n=1 Tax=Culicoidibacter larvae TaxID=2579976 RepID=A0A5R8Q9U9_9FIRM|nr:MraY family glycosyltransferase [Culicoidibacter larvae]TLG72696.1 undecaprenyl/decaprenyl-phosphate alpha-N-acetylglucosaminyl 1-phosphate transferase [Culicoidibacter larvae]